MIVTRFEDNYRNINGAKLIFSPDFIHRQYNSITPDENKILYKIFINIEINPISLASISTFVSNISTYMTVMEVKIIISPIKFDAVFFI